MIDWNFLIGMSLLYIGTGVAYSEIVLIRMRKKGKINKSIWAYYTWRFFKPIFDIRMNLGI